MVVGVGCAVVTNYLLMVKLTSYRVGGRVLKGRSNSSRVNLLGLKMTMSTGGGSIRAGTSTGPKAPRSVPSIDTAKCVIRVDGDANICGALACSPAGTSIRLPMSDCAVCTRGPNNPARASPCCNKDASFTIGGNRTASIAIAYGVRGAGVRLICSARVRASFAD